jgi:hypothetical protein
MLPEAKKYWKRSIICLLFFLAVFLIVYFIKIGGEGTFGLAGLIFIPVLAGLCIMFQVSYALYYTFKPKIDLQPIHVRPYLNAFITVGVWLILFLIIMISHSLLRGK